MYSLFAIHWLKENQSQQWKKYHSIIGTWRGGEKSFRSFGAFSWLLETFQPTFALRFVFYFYSPNTEPWSPITQLGLSIILTWTRFGIWRVKLGNWRAKLGIRRAKLGIRRLKVGNKTESKSSLESFQQPLKNTKWAETFSATSPSPNNNMVFFLIFNFGSPLSSWICITCMTGIIVMTCNTGWPTRQNKQNLKDLHQLFPMLTCLPKIVTNQLNSTQLELEWLHNDLDHPPPTSHPWNSFRHFQTTKEADFRYATLFWPN